jgi:ubiquinone/menaquinone biosynthesis C-methylase UbiE
MDIADILKTEALASQDRAEKHADRGRYSRPVKDYEHYLGISMHRTLNRLKKRQDHPLVVLDVMCGGGSAVRELNSKHGVDAFGVDITYHLDLQDRGCNERFIITPAEDLSMIPDNSIDLILNVIGYTEFSTSLYKSMSEALRVLSPGGELHSVPFDDKEHQDDSRSQEAYLAIQDYEKETGQKLAYETTRRLLPPRNMIRSFISSIKADRPMTTRMYPVLHLEKPK